MIKHFNRLRAYVKLKRFLLYAIRWQLSTPIYAIVLYLLKDRFGYVAETMIANLIGACIFFWIDRYIFTKHRHEIQQEKDN